MKNMTKDQAYCLVNTHGVDALKLLEGAIDLILNDDTLRSTDKVAKAATWDYNYEELIAALICAEAKIKEQQDEIRQYQEMVREG